jgi:[ribosomal protein S5]-alanine N-acetyltransferase
MGRFDIVTHEKFDETVAGASKSVAHSGAVFLRPLEESDITERYLSWFRDNKVTMHLEAHDLTKQDALEFLRWGHATDRRFIFAICDAGSGLHIGNVKIGDINLKSMVSDLVTVIGDRSYWGKGYATTAIRLASNLAFKSYKIRKLNAGIYSNNIGSLKAYTRAGWLVEAVLFEQAVGPDGVNDRIVISYFNPELYATLPIRKPCFMKETQVSDSSSFVLSG